METGSSVNIDRYIAGFAPDVREKLNLLRAMVHDVVPEVKEYISYRMPAFKLKGKNLVYIGAFKNHIGFYAISKFNYVFKEELSEYKTNKGDIQLPYNKPIPFDLLKRILEYKAASIEY